MNQISIKPFDVITNSYLPEMIVDRLPTDGDPFEINGELYFVCEQVFKENDDSIVGVIPLVVKNPARIANINQYIKCLSMAHRRIQFKNSGGSCGLEACDEMIIT
jgi:hypothetical protein